MDITAKYTWFSKDLIFCCWFAAASATSISLVYYIVAHKTRTRIFFALFFNVSELHQNILQLGDSFVTPKEGKML